MPQVKLTKRAVEAAKPRVRRYTLFDAELKGFGLRIFPGGAKTWIVEYRANGGGRANAKRRLTLGPVGALTPDEARRAAQEALAHVRLGRDPMRLRQATRKSVTVRELAQRFLAMHVDAKRKPATQRQYRYLLEGILLPVLGEQKAEALTAQEVAKLHLSLKARPFQANRMLAVTGAMYSFGARHGFVAEGCNPARRVERFREHRRERFLSSGELERLGAALREAETVGLPWNVDEAHPNAKHLVKPEDRYTVLSPPAAAAIRLLILTGARLREILDLKWSHVDMERGLLLLPDSKTGRKTVVLNVAAMEVLDNLPRLADYVIAGTTPDAPRADLHRPWRQVSKRAGLEGVRLHDLRHTFASIGAGSGLGLPIIGKLLGHHQVATTQRYAHLDSDPLKRATNAIGRSIAKAMGSGSPAIRPSTSN